MSKIEEALRECLKALHYGRGEDMNGNSIVHDWTTGAAMNKAAIRATELALAEEKLNERKDADQTESQQAEGAVMKKLELGNHQFELDLESEEEGLDLCKCGYGESFHRRGDGNNEQKSTDQTESEQAERDDEAERVEQVRRAMSLPRLQSFL